MLAITIYLDFKLYFIVLQQYEEMILKITISIATPMYDTDF